MKLHSEPKSQEQLLWEDARDLARAQIRTLTRRITDAVYLEIDKLFIEAEANGTAVTAVDIGDVIKNAGPQVKGFINEG